MEIQWQTLSREAARKQKSKNEKYKKKQLKEKEQKQSQRAEWLFTLSNDSIDDKFKSLQSTLEKCNECIQIKYECVSTNSTI